jgi:Zn-dependent peptidase ImmA (M78 family)
LTRINELTDLRQHLGWASTDLIRELVARRHINRATDRLQQLREVLKFFGVASVETWRAIWNESAPLSAYRLAKQQGDPVALAAWMRIGELRAADVETEPFDRTEFREALDEARHLTRIRDPHDWLPKLQETCRIVGVVVLIEKELPKARVNGIARWLSPNKALIQLSVRYLRDDVLWFTFFHEAAHLVLHGKRNGPRDIPPTFIDTKDSEGRAEDEANKFAADLLIPPTTAERLRHITNTKQVRKLADELGIAPGIIVGRLHHEKLKNPSWGADLIVRYQW